MEKREDQMLDRMRKAGRRQAMATADGDGRGAWAPATEVRAKEAEMPSQLLVTPSAPSFHSCHTSLVSGLQHFQLIPASGPLLLPFPPT